MESKGTSGTSLDKGSDKSPSKIRQPRKVDLRARYWAFLFENLRRAVDEIYVTCESDQSVLECKVSLFWRATSKTPDRHQNIRLWSFGPLYVWPAQTSVVKLDVVWLMNTRGGHWKLQDNKMSEKCQRALCEGLLVRRLSLELPLWVRLL